MGQDKAMLVLDGRTLLEHVTATMKLVFPNVIVSVRRLREEIETPQVCDELVERGPLVGLVAGMARVDTPWMFAVPCDMPFVEAAMIIQLAKHRFEPAGKNPPQAVIPMIAGHPQPLAAFYATNSLAVLRKQLAMGDNSIRGAFKHLNVRYVSEDDLCVSHQLLRSFFDLDTPEDLAQVNLVKESK